jgi:hypothetical protein
MDHTKEYTINTTQRNLPMETRKNKNTAHKEIVTIWFAYMEEISGSVSRKQPQLLPPRTQLAKLETSRASAREFEAIDAYIEFMEGNTVCITLGNAVLCRCRPNFDSKNRIPTIPRIPSFQLIPNFGIFLIKV